MTSNPISNPTPDATCDPHVMILDDGELHDVASLLDELGVRYLRLRGGEIEDDLQPPIGLLVATPRRASHVRRGSPAGAKPGRPVRIIVVEEDSTAMRRMLRQMGFHLLVRRPTHPEIWRLLVRRALYQGEERRLDSRITVGSAVALSTTERISRAVLVDISNRGCRILSADAITPDSHLSISVDDADAQDRPLRLSGRVLRCEPGAGSEGDEYSVVMLFDGDFAPEARLALSRLLNRWSTGTDSFAPAASEDASAWSLPPRSSLDQPGFTLDDETDPAIRTRVDVGLELVQRNKGPQEDAAVTELDRREAPRGLYSRQVLAISDDDEQRRVLLGRDLSTGGMRVERLSDLHVGDRFRLALYGPTHSEPFIVSATVHRDDGEDGLALRFEAVSSKLAVELEKMVACLPDVEALQGGEAAGLGAVISEILPDVESSP